MKYLSLLVLLFRCTKRPVYARLGDSVHRIAQRVEQQYDDDEVHVFIGVKTDTAYPVVLNKAKRVSPPLKRVKAVAAVVSRSKLQELQDDPDVDYVEVDGMAYELDTGSAELYGLKMVQAESSLIPKPNISSACNDPDSMKIGIIDSGIAV